MDLRYGIGKNLCRMPDSWVIKALDPWSGSTRFFSLMKATEKKRRIRFRNSAVP
jgi:hypothetical protein